MAQKKLGKQTIKFNNPPSIIGNGTVVGQKEGEGPLKDYFDIIMPDDLWGESSWEKAESKIQIEAFKLALRDANISENNIEYVFAGDLLNQIISSSYAMRQLNIPYFGLYGACSTMSESLSIGAMTIDGGYADNVACITSSHFCTAERQYRNPLEQGSQRPLTAQWTVTGAGATILSNEGKGPFITHITTGKVIDAGIKDANNMGAAMAPAAIDTIVQHFIDTGFTPDDYDLIITGDLGRVGKSVLMELISEEGYDLSKVHTDCGVEIFDDVKQDTHSGGSGCGCAAVVFNGYVIKQIKSGIFNRVLLVSTGALHSPTSIQQGESIPGIAHAVTIDINKG